MPGTPTNVTITRTAKENVFLISWKAPNTVGITMYNVWSKTSRDWKGKKEVVPAYETKCELKSKNVKTGDQIKVQVQAVNGIGETGPWSEEASIRVPDWSSKLKLKKILGFFESLWC